MVGFVKGLLDANITTNLLLEISGRNMDLKEIIRWPAKRGYEEKEFMDGYQDQQVRTERDNRRSKYKPSKYEQCGWVGQGSGNN